MNVHAGGFRLGASGSTYTAAEPSCSALIGYPAPPSMLWGATASLTSTELLRSTGTLMAKYRHPLPERPSDLLCFQICRFCIAALWSIRSTF